MAIGGPLVTIALVRVPRPRALLVLLGGFLVGQLLGATALNFPMMVLARVLAGAAEGAFFGVGLSLAVAAVGTTRGGRATSVIVGDITMGTVVGVPLTTLIGQRVWWRACSAQRFRQLCDAPTVLRQPVQVGGFDGLKRVWFTRGPSRRRAGWRRSRCPARQ